MKAMILAAGLGTRLLPLTENKPKALVEIDGKPLIDIAIHNLIKYGFNEIVINVHHFSNLVVEYLQSKAFNADIYLSDESEELLETGGGIVKAEKFLNGTEPFLVHNVDIISDINLFDFYKRHENSIALATLAVSKRDSTRVFLFTQQMNLAGWEDRNSGKSIIMNLNETLWPFAFAGIHVINPIFFQINRSKKVFSIVEEYLRLCEKNIIKGIDLSANTIIDVGKPSNLMEATKVVNKSN